MNKNISILSAMLFLGVVSASAEDKSALYVTPPTEGADTAIYNLSVKPVLKFVDNEIVVEVNGTEGRHIAIKDGLKLTFGEGILMGDANRDEKVDHADAVAVADNFIGKDVDVDKNRADVNYDGTLTVADANNITNMTK